jgi:transcriptional regulator of heat shock response
MREDKLKQLLSIVIENYIDKGDPIGSKFLHSLEDTDYAPSTLRKYLNILEQEGLLYQPYHSAGRIPTLKGLESYMDTILAVPEPSEEDIVHVDLHYVRDDLRSMIETLGEYMDGAVVGFLKEDEYFYLGLNNLLKETFISDHETTRYIIKFIESKEIIQKLDRKLTKKGNIYYTFIQNGEKLISIMYTKVELAGYTAMITVLGPSRMDHKKNVAIMKQFLEEYL